MPWACAGMVGGVVVSTAAAAVAAKAIFSMWSPPLSLSRCNRREHRRFHLDHPARRWAALLPGDVGTIPLYRGRPSALLDRHGQSLLALDLASSDINLVKDFTSKIDAHSRTVKSTTRSSALNISPNTDLLSAACSNKMT